MDRPCGIIFYTIKKPFYTFYTVKNQDRLKPEISLYPYTTHKTIYIQPTYLMQMDFTRV